MSTLGNTFFPSQRKELTLISHQQYKRVDPKKPDAHIRAWRLEVAMEFQSSGKNLSSMPSWVADAYVQLQKDESYQRRVIFTKDTIMPGITFEIFQAPDSNDRAHLLVGCELSRFRMERLGKVDAPTYELRFRIDAPSLEKFSTWLESHFESTFFGSFVQGQIELDFEAGPAETADDDDELDMEDDEEEDELSPARDEEFYPAEAQRRVKESQRGRRKA